MSLFVDIILMLMIVICLYTDLKNRRIYNKVVLPAAAGGIFFHTAWHGLPGLKFSLIGLTAGLLVFLVPFALGGLGAGDVKLLGAIGALKGSLFVFQAALGSAVAGGLIALVILLRRRALFSALKRLIYAAAMLFVFRKRSGSAALLLLDREPLSCVFPYGAAIFLGTIIAYLFNSLFPF